ncbi:MAG: hypothetical protein M5U26_19735 [Planctomycetota bacterium]|nr:hypothetical protein [Planctomycetota bacterium]
MAKRLQNPFRVGSKMRRIFDALAASRRPLSAEDVARRAKVKLSTVGNMLAAMRNVHHRAPLDKVGVRMERTEAGHALSACAANPDAKRPARKAKRKSTRKQARRWTKRKKR